MSLEGVPDHDAFWGDSNDHMKERTKAYAERAREVVDQRFLLDKIWHPWKENNAENNPFDAEFNVRIFELAGDHCDLPDGPPPFENARDLLMYWESTPKDDKPEKTNQRVIVVSDMHPRLIELLGVLLEIPPEFFLAHCEEFVSLSIVDTSGATKDSSTYWKVPVPRSYRPPQHEPPQAPDGAYSVRLGNFNRGGISYLPYEYISLTSFVSYWGKHYGDDSWTVLLLVDAHKCNLQSSSVPPARFELTDFPELRDVIHEFKLGSSFDRTTRQHRQPVFDMMVEAYGWYDLVPRLLGRKLG